MVTGVTGMRVYLVGGAVRDQLLGRAVRERDYVVVGATREEMLSRGFRLVGKDFPVFLHPETHEEYALARTERKVGPGHRGFVVHADPAVTLEQDLERRDLTINALARAEDGSIIDYFGGRDYLAAGILRHVSPAFREDPLRVLRVARFAARYADLGFVIAADTLVLLREMSAGGELDFLVPERVWQELAGALGESAPSRFFTTLRAGSALGLVLPEIDRLWGVSQPKRWHPEIDTGVHTMLVVDQAAALSEDPVVRFAALTHDLGKGLTPHEEWPRHRGHEERGVALIDGLCERLRAPNRFRALAGIVARLHGKVHRAEELKPGSVLKLLEDADAFRRPERFAQCLLACEADYRGRTGFEDRPYPQGKLLSAALRAAAAVDIAGCIEPGMPPRRIQQLLRTARTAAIRVARGATDGFVRAAPGA
jgi:tRNA nucleotidyltransferase (CCA-adding enzyme)